MRRKLLDRLTTSDAEHFAQVRALLDDAGLSYELDPTLVRGLDYYTRTVFEFTSDALGAQSGVGGGGRYDGLIELLDGPPTPGVGLGGRRRADAAGRRRAARRLRARSTCSSRSPSRTARAPRSSWPARRAAPGCRRSSSWPVARSRASSSTPTASAPATWRSSARTASPRSRTWSPASSATPSSADVIPAILRGGTAA